MHGERQHQGEDADGLDDELHLIGQGDGPHAADGRIDDHDGAADGDGQPFLPAEEHHEDGGVGAGGGGAEHQRIGQHDDAGGVGCCLASIAQGEHLRNGEDLELLQRRGECERQQDHAGADGDHEPHAGNAPLVAQAHTAHGGGAAKHHCGHGSGIEERAEAAAGHQVVAAVLGAGLAPPAKGQHSGQVGGDNCAVDEFHGEPRCPGACSAYRK